MATSANTIYHYTDELDHLFKIVKNGFYPSYCKEEIVTDSKTVKFAIPILSFCDLPMSQVKDHMKKYGEYAIGLKMEWAIKYGMNPVLYLEQKSILNRGIQEMLGFTFLNWHTMLSDDDFDKFYDKVYRGTLSTLQSIKNYKGILNRKGKAPEEYKFYDEREWRYTPKVDTAHNSMYPDIFFEKDFPAMATRFPAKPHFKDYNVPISGADIKYLIVSSDKEVPGLIDVLEKARHLYSNNNEFQLLLTKIKTAKQIHEDF